MATQRTLPIPFIALSVIMTALVIVPILVLFRASLSTNGLLDGGWTLANYYDLWAANETRRVIVNTLIYAFSSVFLGCSLAAVIAWLTERTDMPGKVWVRSLMFSWMAVPPIVMGFGWILLLNPANGLVNKLLQWVFGLSEAPIQVYSFPALITITALSLVPTGFVMIGSLLRNMDPQLEQAARVHGGTGSTVFMRVTLPLLVPGLMSVGMFTFVGVVQTFDLPMVIGLTAQIPVLSQRVYLLASPLYGAPNYGLAAAFGVALLLVAAVLMIIYIRITRAGERYRVVTGKAFRPRLVKLGLGRYGALCFVGFYFALMLLPVAILIWVSFVPNTTLPSFAALQDATLDIYRRVLSDYTLIDAIKNTILLVMVSSSAVVVLASLLAWASFGGRSTVGRILDGLSFAPLAIPPVVFVLAILLLYLQTPLYGTIWLIIIAHSTIYLSFGVRTISAALLQIHTDLPNAALVSGAGSFKAFRLVAIPLVWPQIANAWLWVFAHSARDLTVPLMLLAPGNIVMSTALWTFWDYPDLPGSAATAVLLILGVLLVVVPVQIWSARNYDRAS